jgi:hypothetical protein
MSIRTRGVASIKRRWLTMSLLRVLGEDTSAIKWEEQLGMAEIGAGSGKTKSWDNQWPGEA